MTITVGTITPSVGPTSGWVQVEVLGTGFRVPGPAPDASAPLPPPSPTVRVLFGASESPRVRVISTSRLLVQVPVGDAGACTVTVQNLDDLGAVIDQGSRETAFTFELPKLTGDGDLLRLVREVIQQFKRQVCKNVVLTQDTDWTSDPLAAVRKIAEAETPAVFLVGPTLRKSGIQQPPAPTLARGYDGTLMRARRPRSVDVVFGFGVIADPMTALNLAQAATVFLEKWSVLEIQRVPKDRNSGTLRYEVNIEQDLAIDSDSNEDNKVPAVGSFAVIGFQMLGMPNAPNDGVYDQHPRVDEVDLEVIGTGD